MTCWIVTSGNAIADLLALAERMGGERRVLLADAPPSVPVEALAPSVASVLAPLLRDGDVVLAADRPADKALAAAVSVAAGIPVVSGVAGFVDGAFEARRCAGQMTEWVSAQRPLVAIAEGGAAVAEFTPDVVVDDPAVAARVVAWTPGEGAADLTDARRVVAMGRELADDGGPRALADVLDAALAASRPAAETLGWARDRYVGASGVRVAPQLYVALGISGQLQHVVGCRDADTIVAVNSDASAPVWAHADYGIVGDARAVVPALISALETPAT